MKICLISFDFWNYDHHIVNALQKKGIKAHHINLRHYRHHYPSIFHRIGNFFGKLLFNKNAKKTKREDYILKELAVLGQQDRILIINPEIITIATHKKIKNFTNSYIAYLYDSSKRRPIAHLLEANIFDTVFSFDPEDVETYNLKPLTNYIYFHKHPLTPMGETEYDCFTISYLDERLETMNRIAAILKGKQLNSHFIVVGKNEPAGIHPDIIFTEERQNQEQVHENIKKSIAVLDLLRDDQAGLSFRIFEAMGFQKKIITSNEYVKEFDFYNPENILVINPEKPEIPTSFFESPYVPIPQEIYRKYTLEGWVEQVFRIQ
ncbi:hypothetical protein QRD02_11505 [Aequorivita sp. SDUM287046]|uniref:Glycosyltransferase family 1 protein n=1 Tax=Aequorivita aurantiaca TaxID=3053356 RepID=A0ABT8DI51_9FLAO|nr:hypothetical protein [Aequorivita aurantiaca]MDN3725013.1 hypothetical protein [Aequorivita aurantiaca]